MTAEQNRAAATLGFRFEGLYRHAKRGRYNLLRFALWLSPDRRSIAVVTWGRLWAFVVGRAMLYSRCADGRILVTSNKPTGLERTGMYEMLILFRAPFDALLRRHERRRDAAGVAVVPFGKDDTEGQLADIVAARFRHVVSVGELCYTDAGETAARSTFIGALKAFGRTSRRPPHSERYVAGTIQPLRPQYPSWLVWTDRTLMVLWLLILFVSLALPAPTTGKGLFLVGLLGLTLMLGLLVFLLKLAHRRREA